MKKLSLWLIAISFCLLSAGTALAEEPKTDVLDRNAVWTNKSGIDEATYSNNGSSRQVSVKKIEPGHMNGKAMEFDFIRETKSYDHANVLKLST